MVSEETLHETRINPFLESFFLSFLYLSLFTYFSLLVSSTFVSFNTPICFCFMGNLFSPLSAIFSSMWDMVLQMLTCLISYTAYRKNRSKIDNFDTSTNGSLNVLGPRYKVWTNLQATRWLMPLTLLDSTITFLLFSSYNVCLILFDVRSQEVLNLIGLGMTIILSVQSIIFPIMSIRFYLLLYSILKICLIILYIFQKQPKTSTVCSADFSKSFQ